MYKITRLLSGCFWCEGMIQDGTERWKEDSIEKAIESMISFAKTMNNDDITHKNIDFGYEKHMQQIVVEPFEYKPKHPATARIGTIIRENLDPHPNSYYPSQSHHEVIVSFLRKEDAENFKKFLEEIK